MGGQDIIQLPIPRPFHAFGDIFGDVFSGAEVRLCRRVPTLPDSGVLSLAGLYQRAGGIDEHLGPVREYHEY